MMQDDISDNKNLDKIVQAIEVALASFRATVTEQIRGLGEKLDATVLKAEYLSDRRADLDKMDALTKEVKEIKQNNFKMVWAVILAMISSIGTIATTVVTSFILNK